MAQTLGATQFAHGRRILPVAQVTQGLAQVLLRRRFDGEQQAQIHAATAANRAFLDPGAAIGTTFHGLTVVEQGAGRGPG